MNILQTICVCGRGDCDSFLYLVVNKRVFFVSPIASVESVEVSRRFVNLDSLGVRLTENFRKLTVRAVFPRVRRKMTSVRLVLFNGGMRMCRLNFPAHGYQTFLR